MRRRTELHTREARDGVFDDVLRVYSLADCPEEL